MTALPRSLSQQSSHVQTSSTSFHARNAQSSIHPVSFTPPFRIIFHLLVPGPLANARYFLLQSSREIISTGADFDPVYYHSSRNIQRVSPLEFFLKKCLVVDQ